MSIKDPYEGWSKKPGDLEKEFTPAANPSPDGPPPNDRNPPKQSDHAPAPGMKPKPPGSVGQEVDNATHAERQSRLREALKKEHDQKGPGNKDQDKSDSKNLRDIFKEKADKDGKDGK